MIDDPNSTLVAFPRPRADRQRRIDMLAEQFREPPPALDDGGVVYTPGGRVTVGDHPGRRKVITVHRPGASASIILSPDEARAIARMLEKI